MKISVVIPAHNEAAPIVDTIRQLEHVLSLSHEVIVVNDHSCDNTVQLVRGLSKEFANIRLVENTQCAGFANALKAGFSAAEGDLIVPVMADLCDDPATIAKMYEKITEGFDVVCGSRYMSGGKKIGGPRLKSFFSKFVGLSLHFLIGMPSHDIANSFKMYKMSVLNSIDIEAEGFEISVEIPLKAFFASYKITEVPTIWIDRKKGTSKFNVGKQGLGYLKLYLRALIKGIKKCLIKKS